MLPPEAEEHIARLFADEKEPHRLRYRAASALIAHPGAALLRTGRRTVRVRFARPDGEEGTVELQVADPNRLAAALATVTERVR